MRRPRSLAVMLTVIIMSLPATMALAGYDYINISNPFLHKIPIAVAEFMPLPAPKATPADIQNTRDLAVPVTDLLSDTLVFTCYFNSLDRASFLGRPQEKGVTAVDINYKNWRDIGADFLITGSLTCKGDDIVMEMRLFDVYQMVLLIGKKYRGKRVQYQTMVYRFCADVLEYFTGRRGMFQSRIAFVSNGPGNKEIYICDFDGKDPKRFTHNNTINMSPAWSSDGQWLAFTTFQDSGPSILIKNLTDKRSAVVSRKGANISPAWVPGKLELAASLSFSGDQEIYLLDSSGTLLKRLTYSWGIDVSPTFSPDGKKMAFVSKRAGTPQIFIQDLASDATQRLTFEGNYNTTPSWSPAGDKIAYCGSEGGHFNIYVIDLETLETVRLTYDQGDNESPTWSPDGSLIAYSSTREGGRAAIYLMTSAGTDQKRLLKLPGEQTCPRWSLNIETVR